MEAARLHPQSIQGGWFVWPRSKLGGGGSYSSIRAGAIYRLQYGASPAAGSAVPAPIPSGHLPWEPLPPYLVAGGSWPSKRAHLTHIPPCLHTHTHLEPPLGLGARRQQLLHQAVLGCCQ